MTESVKKMLAVALAATLLAFVVVITGTKAASAAIYSTTKLTLCGNVAITVYWNKDNSTTPARNITGTSVTNPNPQTVRVYAYPNLGINSGRGDNIVGPNRTQSKTFPVVQRSIDQYVQIECEVVGTTRIQSKRVALGWLG